jgi:hypothetical protein
VRSILTLVESRVLVFYHLKKSCSLFRHFPSRPFSEICLLSCVFFLLASHYFVTVSVCHVCTGETDVSNHHVHGSLALK